MAKPIGLIGCNNHVDYIANGICRNGQVEPGFVDLIDLIGFVHQVDLIVGISPIAVKWQLNGFNGFVGLVDLIGRNDLIGCISLNGHIGCNIELVKHGIVGRNGLIISFNGQVGFVGIVILVGLNGIGLFGYNGLVDFIASCRTPVVLVMVKT
jgi:hypothetical protein